MFAEFWTDYDYIIPLSRSWVRAFKSFAHEHSGISRNNARLSERILSAAFYIATSPLYLHSLPTSFNLHSCRFWEYIYFFNLTFFFFLNTHTDWNIFIHLMLLKLPDIMPVWSTSQMIICLDS